MLNLQLEFQFAAKHPFQIILSTLLTAFAYVRVIEHFKKLMVFTGSVFHAMNLNQLIYTTHHIVTIEFDQWSIKQCVVHQIYLKFTSPNKKKMFLLTCPIKEIDESHLEALPTLDSLFNLNLTYHTVSNKRHWVYQLRPLSVIAIYTVCQFEGNLRCQIRKTSDPTDIFVISSAYSVCSTLCKNYFMT